MKGKGFKKEEVIGMVVVVLGLWQFLDLGHGGGEKANLCTHGTVTDI